MSMTNGTKYERKYFAHFIDTSFGTGSSSWKRLGKDLEELNIELSPEEETKKNILGENSTRISGYEVSYSVDTFYAEKGDALFTKLMAIVNNRSTGDGVLTKVLDILVDSEGTIESAFVEDAIVIPQSIGGDTTGVQIPFNVKYNGNRKDVTSSTTISDGVPTISSGSGGSTGG